ncbi:single-stranded DNA-binding protein [Streptomyces sp. P17]|jgi:single-strand DNA-binding protein|nr:single-stranded DNA-binding protein [Streptomyces sp. P17]MDM7320465.1 single-stranded DNA-binding protein [Fervidobacterium sp.]MDT9700926.1 single-stranded DNA-binding protein [Streptomyces sp. P17]
MINNVVLVGRLTKDPDLRYTGNGTAVAAFTMAVERSFNGADGQKQTDFISCVVWRKQAETLANYTRKGSLLGVQGRLQSRSYDNQQGQKVFVTEVVVEEFQFLETKAQSEQRQQAPAGNGNYGSPSTPPNQNGYSNQNNGYSNNQNGGMPSFARGASPIDISDDDLPF